MNKGCRFRQPLFVDKIIMVRHMKKIIFLITAMIAVMGFSAHADAEFVRYYDAAAYINNYPIPCYDINGYCGIFVKDLRSYGFDVDYNHEEQTVRVTRNGETHISGIDGVALPYQSCGTEYKPIGETSIKVYLGGVETEAYWVDGNMMVLLDKMYAFGSVDWNEEAWALFVTVNGMDSKEYEPLKKSARPYRPKPDTWQLDKNKYYNYPTEEVDWGFVRVKRDEPNLYSWQVSMIEKFNGYYMDRSKPHKLYLTFDEGYEAGYTPKILDVLEKYNVPATFFVTGEFLDSSPHLVRLMIDNGFTVGNHTVNHKNLAQCDIGTVMNEIEIVSNRLRSDFSYETHYMRPPEGAISERALAIADDMGYNTILWSFAYMDYDESVQKGTDYAYDMLTTYMHDGAIMLIHAISKDNANALEDFILYAKENGFEFGSLDDLCNP